VPTGAGVGSAIGFLRAPIAYEVVRSRYARLSAFEPAPVNAALDEMRAEAYGIVRPAAPGAELSETRLAYMRYLGQGHEISVALPARVLKPRDADALRESFDAAYRSLYGRTIPGLDIEVLSWTLTVQSVVPVPERLADAGPPASAPEPFARRPVFESEHGAAVDVPVYRRAGLAPGARIPGPALIVEDQTTTVVSSAFEASVIGLGYLVLDRRPMPEPARNP
jgi:N-methylhydantoinase A